MAKCVLRIDKYTQAQSSKVNLHNNRKFEQEASNIDRERSALNQKFVGSDNLNSDLSNALKNNTNKRALRNDANVMLEVILSASPEHFFTEFDKNKFDLSTVENDKDYFRNLYKNNLNKKSLESYKNEVLNFCKTDEFFKGNVISIDLHMDEKTPHFHICLVPKMPDGRVCCKEYWTPVKTIELQNRYAKHMQKLGLERGQENSEAVHTSHHTHKPNVPEAPQVSIPALEKPKLFTKAAAVYDNAIEREKAQKLKYDFYKNFYEDNKKTIAYSKTQAEQIKLYKKENKQLKLSQKRYKEEELKNLRTISIESVCQELGYKLSRKQINSKSYRIASKDKQEIIYDDKNRFSETFSKKTGQGAISFLTDCASLKFEKAISFLRERFSSQDIAEELFSSKHKESAISLISNQVDKIAIENNEKEIQRKQRQNELEMSLKQIQDTPELGSTQKNGFRMRM